MKTETSSSIPKSKLALPIAGRDHIQGPIDAPIILLEYGDYECPYCGAAYPEIKAVQAQLGDRLCFAFRNFPLVNSHAHAQHAAEIAEAAGAQGRFWEMHDLLYEHQEALEDGNLAQYATALGLDGRRLIAEVLAGTYTARVREDFRSGARAGVNGTPTLFINGAIYTGRPDADTLLAALTKRTVT
jgi:protein-disulfide isomerase